MFTWLKTVKEKEEGVKDSVTSHQSSLNNRRRGGRVLSKGESRKKGGSGRQEKKKVSSCRGGCSVVRKKLGSYLIFRKLRAFRGGVVLKWLYVKTNNIKKEGTSP